MSSKTVAVLTEARAEALATGTPLRDKTARAPCKSFETTRWRVILGAGQGIREHVVDLCESYWYPVYAFIRRQGANAEEAHDITQDLFAALIRRNDFAKVVPERGRFRSWLRTAAKNQLRNYFEAERPPPGVTLASLDAMSAEERYQLEPMGDALAPDRLFDRCWAATLVRRAREELRITYERGGRAVLFAKLEPTLVRDESDISDAELCKELGKTAVNIRQTRLRMKDEFGRLLRAEVGRTLVNTRVDARTIDEELRQLLHVSF